MEVNNKKTNLFELLVNIELLEDIIQKKLDKEVTE